MKRLRITFSNWIKEPGNIISIIFLVFVLSFVFRFIFTGTLFGGSIDSARYLLSTLAQTQGAIVAIVISLTIVAVQVGSQAYSLRTTDLLLRYEFFWLLLALYGISIIYDVVLLNRLNNDNIGLLGTEVNISIIIAAIIFWALFPYSKKTIGRLRPQTIIQILGKRVLANNKKTFDSNRKEDILPLFDITKKSIRVDDIATARDSVRKLEAVCRGILFEELDEEKEKAAVEYFAEQYQRTAKIAFIQNDIDSTIEISSSLSTIANEITEKELSLGRTRSITAIADKLGDIGELATERKWEDVLEHIANTLSDLTIKCAEWKSAGTYLSDGNLQGVNRLTQDIKKDASYAVLHILSKLNLKSMQTDVLLAARNTKRPLISALTRLIQKKFAISFYEGMPSEIVPIIRSQDIFGVNYNWLPHIADILVASGVESAEILGEESLATTFKQYLLYAVATKPSDELKNNPTSFGIAPEEIIRVAIATIFNYINGVDGDKGAIWLIEAIGEIGAEYNKKGFVSPAQKSIEELGFIGSSIHFEGKNITVRSSLRALDSIQRIVMVGRDQGLLEEAFISSLRILIEADDKGVQDRTLDLFRESSKSIEKSAFKAMVDSILNTFKTQNKIELESASQRKTRFESFSSELSSILHSGTEAGS